MFKVSGLLLWMNGSFGSEIVSAGLDYIKPVYLQMIKHKNIPNREPPNTPFSANSSISDSGIFFNRDDLEIVESQAQNEQCGGHTLKKALDVEVISFANMIGNNQTLVSCTKTSNFWKKNIPKLPKLVDLFIIISNIPAASAGIERFFNMTGLINNDRRLRMKDDLVEMRSLFKVNLPILDELSMLSEDFNND